MKNFFLFQFILFLSLILDTTYNRSNSFSNVDSNEIFITLKTTNSINIKKISEELRKKIGDHVLLGRHLADSTIEISFDISNMDLKNAMLEITKIYNKKVLILNSKEGRNIYPKLNLCLEPINSYCYIWNYSNLPSRGPIPKYLKLKFISCEKLEKAILDQIPGIEIASIKEDNAIAYSINLWHQQTIEQIISKYDVKPLSTSEIIIK